MWGIGIVLIFGIPISISDIRTRRIPNRYLFPMFVTSEIALLLSQNSFSIRFWSSNFFHLNLLLLIFLIAGICLVAITPRVMGMGDIKLLAVLILLSKNPITWFSMLFLATFFGLLWGLITRKRSIPFAPSILLATLLCL